MASENLEKAIGRAVLDENFRIKWLKDFEDESDKLDIIDVKERIKAEHFLKEFNKSQMEKGQVKKEIPEGKRNLTTNYITNNPMENITDSNNKIGIKKINENNQDLSSKVNEYIFSTFQSTINDSRSFLKKVVYITHSIIGIGIIFFILSYLCGIGIFGNSLTIGPTIIFGFLGILVSIFYFVFEPVKRIQKIIANLLKIEIIYLHYWEQVNFWRPFGNSDDEHKKKEASERLNSITKTSIEFLKEYIGENNDRKTYNSWINKIRTFEKTLTSPKQSTENDTDNNKK